MRSSDESWYQGTADAVYQNINLIEQAAPDVVAVFGADHIYRMNIAQMIDFHDIAQERELRVVLQCYDPMAGVNRHCGPDNFPHREPLDDLNPLHPWVHDSKRRRIDLKALVTEIRLSPWATPEEFEEVGWWVKNKNLFCPIKHSECEGSFTPTPEELKKYGF
jgi:hypothetical protein